MKSQIDYNTSEYNDKKSSIDITSSLNVKYSSSFQNIKLIKKPENYDSEPCLKTKIIGKLRAYSENDLEEFYNFERNIAENQEALLNSRNLNYFDYQNFIDPKMRVILLNWIMEVCSSLLFKRATYHSTVVLIDIFLSKYPNLKTNLLQLLGVTCLIIAAKNEVRYLIINLLGDYDSNHKRIFTLYGLCI